MGELVTHLAAPPPRRRRRTRPLPWTGQGCGGCRTPPAAPAVHPCSRVAACPPPPARPRAQARQDPAAGGKAEGGWRWQGGGDLCNARRTNETVLTTPPPPHTPHELRRADSLCTRGATTRFECASGAFVHEQLTSVAAVARPRAAVGSHVLPCLVVCAGGQNRQARGREPEDAAGKPAQQPRGANPLGRGVSPRLNEQRSAVRCPHPLTCPLVPRPHEYRSPRMVSRMVWSCPGGPNRSRSTQGTRKGGSTCHTHTHTHTHHLAPTYISLLTRTTSPSHGGFCAWAMS